MVEVLQRAGVRVDFPLDQTCCGQPTFNAGLRADARRIAEHTIRVFEAAEGDVVIPSGSCAHMIRHNYSELFDGDALWEPRAEALARRTYEFTEYLVDVLGLDGVWRPVGRATDISSDVSPAPRAWHRQATAGSASQRARRGSAGAAGGRGLLRIWGNLLGGTAGAFGGDAQTKDEEPRGYAIPHPGGVRCGMPDAHPRGIASEANATAGGAYRRSAEPSLEGQKCITVLQ